MRQKNDAGRRHCAFRSDPPQLIHQRLWVEDHDFIGRMWCGKSRPLGKSWLRNQEPSGHRSKRQSSNILLIGRFETSVATNVWAVPRSIPNLHKLSASVLNPQAGFRGWCGHVLRAKTKYLFQYPSARPRLGKIQAFIRRPLAFDE
jgi:hypothetical protein